MIRVSVGHGDADEDAIWDRLFSAVQKHTTTKAIAKSAKLTEEQALHRLKAMQDADLVIRCGVDMDCWRPTRFLAETTP